MPSCIQNERHVMALSTPPTATRCKHYATAFSGNTNNYVSKRFENVRPISAPDSWFCNDHNFTDIFRIIKSYRHRSACFPRKKKKNLFNTRRDQSLSSNVGADTRKCPKTLITRFLIWKPIRWEGNNREYLTPCVKLDLVAGELTWLQFYTGHVPA